MDSNVLPFFWHLASSSKDTRLKASSDLISSLEKFQRTFEEGRSFANEEDDRDDDDDDEEEDSDESGEEIDGGDDDPESSEEDAAQQKLDRTLTRRHAEDVVYSVKRLIRGLASSRDSSRLGFAVALTELLSRIQSFTAAQILSLIIRSSPHSMSMKGPEKRDALFARLFGLTSLVRSGCIFRSTSDTETIIDVADHLMELGKTKGWLRESAWWSLMTLMEGLPNSQVEQKDDVSSGVIEKIFEEKTWSQEKVAIVLSTERVQPKTDMRDLLDPTFKHSPLLASANLTALGRILKEGGAPEEDEEDEPSTSTSTGSWKPQLHFVWDTILDSYFPQSSETMSSSALKTKRAPFPEFFRAVVDENLFADNSSPERKYWGFQVLLRTLPLLPAEDVPLLFTPNLMRSWTNNLSSSDRYLHKISLTLASQVQSLVKSNPRIGFSLLSPLVGKGKVDFDRITKTKTVESILGNLDAEGVREYVAYLNGLILGEDSKKGSDSTSLEDSRLWALDQILVLFRNGSVPKSDDWVSEILDLLLVQGYFSVPKAIKKSEILALKRIPQPPVSRTVQEAYQTRLVSCLTEITTASPSVVSGSSSSSSRQQGCNAEGKVWLRRSLDLMAALEAMGIEAISEADEEIVTARKDAVSTLKALDKVQTEHQDIRLGYEILLCFVILQTYGEDEDAVDMLEQIDQATRQAYSLLDASNVSSSSKIIEAPAIDQIVDVLIGFLEKGSHELRSLANLVVGLIAPAFSSTTIDHLVAQLEETSAANDVEADESEAAEDDDSDEDEDDEDDMDDEASEDGGDDTEDSDDDEEQEEEDDDPMAPVDPDFRKRVAEALQVSGMADDEGDDDSHEETGDGSSSEEEYWDDDQMMKVDEQLAEVFRQRATRAKKADIKNLQVESQHFKHRILDFFDVFARKQPSNPLVTLLILPLLRLVQTASTKEADLSNKAASIIRSRFAKAKETPSTGIDTMETLRGIHELARKAPSADFSALCSLCSVFLCRIIDSAPNAPSDQLLALAIYRTTLKDYMTRKSSLVHPPFVADHIRRFPVASFQLARDILSFTDAKVYRQLQGYNLLQIFSQNLNLIAKTVSKPDVESVLVEVAKRTYDILHEAAGEAKPIGAENAKPVTSQWNAQRLKDIVKVTLHFVRTSKSVLSPEQYAKVWDLPRLEGTLIHLKESERTREMKGVHGMLEQMLAVLGTKKLDGGKEAKKVMKGNVKAVKEEVANKAEPSKSSHGEGGKKRKSTDGTQVPNGDAEHASKQTKKVRVSDGTAP